MTPFYRIVIISPPGYAHSSCFLEVARLLVCSFVSLGVKCDVKLNELAQDRTNVLLGFHLIKDPALIKDHQYIPYQLEQLSDTEGAYSEVLRKILEGAAEIWDYSAENIAFLSARGLKAKHLPVGYHEGLELIPQDREKEIDVLFYGSVGSRRKPVLDRLAGRTDMRFRHLFGAYGKERDDVIAKSKIILNIHYYEARIFEAVRISYLLNNKCFVLTEDSANNPYPGVDIPAAPYDDLEKMCEYYVKTEGEREHLRMKAYEQFREGYPMASLLAKVYLKS